MLEPKKLKYRKMHRNRSGMKGPSVRGNTICFGDFGLKAIEKGEVSARQIEAARKSMVKDMKRGGKLWIRIFPQKPITQKAAEVPMGAGKGAVDHYVASVKRGAILFEVTGIPEKDAVKTLSIASYKLPFHCSVVKPHLR
jgi:large subunit ribosomal protein L16